MPNGKDEREAHTVGRRKSDYNPNWCQERHDKIDKRLDEIWGEDHGGIKAIWGKMDSLNQKLWSIIIGQVAIIGGIVAILVKEVL